MGIFDQAKPTPSRSRLHRQHHGLYVQAEIACGSVGVGQDEDVVPGPREERLFAH